MSNADLAICSNGRTLIELAYMRVPSITISQNDRERTQVFDSVVIRKRGKGPAATFTVRRISNQIGVERTFLLYSPLVA